MAVPTPTSVPMVSNISIKRKIKMTVTPPSLNVLTKSSLKNVGAIVGGRLAIPWNFTTPIKTPISAVVIIPISMPPFILNAKRMEIIKIPIIASKTGGECRLPRETMPPGLLMIIPA